MYAETQKEQAMIVKDEDEGEKDRVKASLHEMIAATNSYLPHY